MKLRALMAVLLLIALTGCSGLATGKGDTTWVTLFDGTSLAGWDKVGNANWRLADGLVEATEGSGFLVSKDDYADFELRAEFWVDSAANSGIFIRCTDPQKITATSGYEVNVFDQRPDPKYGTGAIVSVGAVAPMPKAGGRWNVFEITARGSQFTVTLNGMRTVENASDARHANGRIALQYAAGIVKFRKVQIRTL